MWVNCRSLGRFIYFEIEIRFRSQEIINYFRSLGRWKRESWIKIRISPSPNYWFLKNSCWWEPAWFRTCNPEISGWTPLATGFGPGGIEPGQVSPKKNWTFWVAKTSKTTFLRKLPGLQSPKHWFLKNVFFGFVAPQKHQRGMLNSWV